MSKDLKPRRRGRPPLDADDPSVKVTVSMPGRRFADVQLQAQRQQDRR